MVKFLDEHGLTTFTDNVLREGENFNYAKKNRVSSFSNNVDETNVRIDESLEVTNNYVLYIDYDEYFKFDVNEIIKDDLSASPMLDVGQLDSMILA